MRCVLGLAMLRDRKKWRVSGLAAVPQGKTRRKTGSTLLRDGETRRKTRRVGPTGRGKGTHKGGGTPLRMLFHLHKGAEAGGGCDGRQAEIARAEAAIGVTRGEAQGIGLVIA